MNTIKIIALFLGLLATVPVRASVPLVAIHDSELTRALETLPAQMEAVQERLAKLRAILDDAGLYSRDPALFDKATHAAAKSESELAALEEQWLELEVLREELEG